MIRNSDIRIPNDVEKWSIICVAGGRYCRRISRNSNCIFAALSTDKEEADTRLYLV